MEALEAIQLALVDEPTSAQLLGTQAHILVAIGRLTEAENSIKAALDCDPNDPHFHNLIGYIAERQGALEAAIRAVGKAVELAPDNPDFRRKLQELRDDLPSRTQSDWAATTSQIRSDKVLGGREGWLFHRVDHVFEQICGHQRLSDRNLSRLCSLWEARQAWCEVRNIEYRVLIVPERHVLYSDKLPSGYLPSVDRPALKIIRAAASIRERIIYPVSSLRNGREVHEVCYKTDVHWTRYGAYLAYRELIRSIAQCADRIIPESALLRSEIRLVGDMTLWLERRYREVAEFFDPPATKVTEVFTNRTFRPGQVDVYETDQPWLPSLVLFRTSNSTHLLPFLYHHFSRIVAVASTAVHFELLRSEMPDVVISEISERYLAPPDDPPSQDSIRFPRDFDVESFSDLTGQKLPLPSSVAWALSRAARVRQ